MLKGMRMELWALLSTAVMPGHLPPCFCCNCEVQQWRDGMHFFQVSAATAG